MQILVRTVHTVQQTVDFHRYSSWDGCGRACCCATKGALVGTRRKLWSLAVAVLVGVVQFLDKVVVPVGATTGAWVRMLCSTVDTYSASFQGGLLWTISHIFYVKVELGSSGLFSFLPATRPTRKWPLSSSTVAVACILLVWW